MTQEERDNILLELKAGQEKLFKGYDELKEGQEKLFKGYDELKAGQEKLFEGYEELKEGQKSLKDEVKELKRTVDRIDQTVMRIEVEHGEKLQILFDADLYKREKFDSQGHTLERHERILDKHSDEIYLLKSKVQG